MPPSIRSSFAPWRAPAHFPTGDLRCEIRDKLIGFLQESYPGALPKQRTELWMADGHPFDFEAMMDAGRVSLARAGQRPDG